MCISRKGSWNSSNNKKCVLNCVNVHTSYISWATENSKKEEEMKEWKMCITRKDMRNSSHILNITNVIKTNWN